MRGMMGDLKDTRRHWLSKFRKLPTVRRLSECKYPFWSPSPSRCCRVAISLLQSKRTSYNSQDPLDQDSWA